VNAAGRPTPEELVRERLELLRRESHNLAEARRILRDMEAGSDIDRAIVREGRRSVELAEEARRLGILDASRVGASTEQIVEVTQLPAGAIVEILRRSDAR
jgi:hypothetical protein